MVSREVSQHKDTFGTLLIRVSLYLFQLIEAVVLPMTHKERFEALGIQPPKGKGLYLGLA